MFDVVGDSKAGCWGPKKAGEGGDVGEGSVSLAGFSSDDARPVRASPPGGAVLAATLPFFFPLPFFPAPCDEWGGVGGEGLSHAMQ